MEVIMEFIRPELLILLPVLYFLGCVLKMSERVGDKYIPAVLGGAGIVLATLWVLSNASLVSFQDWMLAFFAGITQGVLCAGGCVYVNQLIKQAGKEG